MRTIVIKEFEISEGSTENMWYKIEVFSHGDVVETFLEPTMQAAHDAFKRAGYQRQYEGARYQKHYSELESK